MTPKSVWSRVVIGGFLLLLLNSAYLASFSEPTLWYYTQVALHPMLGVGLSAIVVLALARRRLVPGRLAGIGLFFCGVGFVAGVALFATGATSAYRGLVYAHVALSAAGAACLLTSFVMSGFPGSRAAIAATLVGV